MMSWFSDMGIINWVGGVDYALLEANLAWLHTGDNPTLTKSSPVMSWADSSCGRVAKENSELPPRLNLWETSMVDLEVEEDDEGFIWMEWFWEDCIDASKLGFGFSAELANKMRKEKYPVLVITQPLPPHLEYHALTLTRFMRELHRAHLLQGIGQPREQKSDYDSWVVCLDSKVNAMILRNLKTWGRDAPEIWTDFKRAKKGRVATLEFLKQTVGNAGLSKM